MPRERSTDEVPEPKTVLVKQPSFADLVRKETPNITVNPRDKRMRIQIVQDTVKGILGPGLDVTMVNGPDSQNPGRVSELGQFGYEPLRFTDDRLTDKQRKELRRHLILKAEGMLYFGDLLVMYATEENAERRRKFKEEQRLLSEHAMRDRESAAAQTRELGVAVEDKW